MTSRLEKRLENQRSQRVKVWSILLMLILFTLVATASYLWFSGGTLEKARRNAAGLISPGSNKVNILVMGVDERQEDVGRSDTLFLLTVDTKTNAVSLLSVPRDTRVKIPGHGWDKINSAFAYGGHKLSQEAVEDLLGIGIDYYIKINFAGFKKIIDAVGGVDINVEKRMHYADPYDDNGGLYIDLKPGLQHMDGATAIQYVRYRDEEGDIGRIGRQQKFMKAMLKEVISPAIITRIPSIIQEVVGAIDTNMSTSEMLNLAKILNEAYKQGLQTDMVPGKPAYINDISYWLPDISLLRTHVAQIEGIPLDNRYRETSRRMAGEYQNSIPREMKVTEAPAKALQLIKPVKPNKPDKTNLEEKPKPPDQPAPPPRPKQPDAPAAKTSAEPARIRIDIVNASGVADAGEKVAALLRNEGFEVTGVTNITAPYKNTVVVSNTTDSAVVNHLTGLPFKYSLQVTKDDSKSTQATVVLGTDYANQ
ncbi:lytr cell envelope-related transcriptional attenuator [Lucifera butyrica]|uniref:Lytr cell envelope-related transcriptional attenuator n=1 Tax=Lucifera butyrica TaxID=1351585 RepID=A0A498RC69_9FIRM|nr:LCP family protein [Lucifera butyrica]VBB08839.1 lytr cell envelope-related transcriptional attenuator [Lucifera butyrica]